MHHDEKMCKEILERFIREWIGTGEEFLDTGLCMDEVCEWLKIGKGVKMAHKVYTIVQEMNMEDSMGEGGSGMLKLKGSMTKPLVNGQGG